MGNCCKKKTNLTDKISISSKSSNTKKENNITEKDKKKTKGVDILILKDNDPGTREHLKADNNGFNTSKNLSKYEKKKLDEYKIILDKYIEFREKLESKSKENIYVVKENDTIDLVKLYNSIQQ